MISSFAFPLTSLGAIIAFVLKYLNAGTGIQGTVLTKIKGNFANLQLKVRQAMDKQHVNVDDLHQFLVAFFQSDYRIPKKRNLTEMFNFLSENELLHFNDCEALEQIVNCFLPDEKSIKESLAQYSNHHFVSSALIKIADFVPTVEENSEENTNQVFTPENYKKHFHTLKIKLTLDKKLTEMTLQDVNEFWQSLSKKFDLPPLTTVLDKILTGSLVIIWLILPRIAEKIKKFASKALDFYRDHNVVEVYVDDEPLYKEDWLVSL